MELLRCCVAVRPGGGAAEVLCGCESLGSKLS